MEILADARKGIKIKTKWTIRPIQSDRIYFILEVSKVKKTTTQITKQQSIMLRASDFFEKFRVLAA